MIKRKGFLLWLFTFSIAVLIIGSRQLLYLGLLLYIISVLLIFKFNKLVVNKKIIIKPINLFVIVFVIFSSKFSLFLSRYLTEFFNLYQYNSTIIWMLCWYIVSTVLLFIVWKKPTLKEKKSEFSYLNI